MAVSTGDILRIAARQETDGVDDSINVMHFEVFTPPTGGSDASALEDLADHFGLAWQLIAGLYPNYVNPVDLQVYNITDDAPTGVIAWAGGYDGGTSGGESLPHQDAAMVLWSTGVKRRIGRTYLGPLAESAQANSRLVAGTITAIENWTAYIRESVDAPNGGDYRLVIWSRQAGARSVPTAVRVAPIVAHQQRRKPGRGS